MSSYQYYLLARAKIGSSSRKKELLQELRDLENDLVHYIIMKLAGDPHGSSLQEICEKEINKVQKEFDEIVHHYKQILENK